jgi:hypothetical protein
MILFNRQVLFVHNPKTAGSSVLSFLKTILPKPLYFAGVKEIDTYHPSLSTAIEYACSVTRNQASDFRRIITCIRNPYDREVSMYCYFRDVLNNSPSLKADLNDPAIESIVRRAGMLDFGPYLEWLYTHHGTCDIWQSRRFYSLDDTRIPYMLSVLHTESLDTEIREALRGVDVVDDSSSVPRLNASTRGPTRDYFDIESEQVVTNSYEWIFEDGFYKRGVEHA